MKCIAYVSKVVDHKEGAMVPNGLSRIYGVARKKNEEFGITGVMSFRNGYYFQMIEGDDRAVDQLYANIILDDRHEKVTSLFSFSIAERAFETWGMRLLMTVDKDSQFKEFMRRNSTAISQLNETQSALLRPFWKSKTEPVPTVERYDGKELMLSAWPDFTAVTPTPMVIELCARLTTAPHSYSELIAGGEFGSQKELDKILNAFGSLNVLKVTDSVSQPIRSPDSKKTTGFYSKMKNFLTAR